MSGDGAPQPTAESQPSGTGSSTWRRRAAGSAGGGRAAIAAMIGGSAPATVPHPAPGSHTPIMCGVTRASGRIAGPEPVPTTPPGPEAAVHEAAVHEAPVHEAPVRCSNPSAAGMITGWEPAGVPHSAVRSRSSINLSAHERPAAEISTSEPGGAPEPAPRSETTITTAAAGDPAPAAATGNPATAPAPAPTPAGRLGPDSVVAVVVTRHRAELLTEALAVLAAQTRAVDHLIVVDNGPDRPAQAAVEGCGIPATWLPSWNNLGGAGGFALGMLHALAMGAGWVWLADDDGRAADADVLATLLELAQRRGLAAVSPTVADLDEPDRLAFPVRRGLTWHSSRAALATAEGADPELLPGIAALFNGALFRASTLDVVGVPDLRLFVRGDEVEMHRRLVRSGLPFGTALRAAYLHPPGRHEDKPMLGGRLHARDPEDEVKRYYTYRNRGYLISQPGMRRVGLLEFPRFAWYFLITRRSPAEFVSWFRLIRQGRAERFHRA